MYHTDVHTVANKLNKKKSNVNEGRLPIVRAHQTMKERIKDHLRRNVIRSLIQFKSCTAYTEYSTVEINTTLKKIQES